MATLSEILLTKRPEAVKALSKVVDDEVAGRGGLGGMAIKTAFGAAQKARPGLVEKAIDKMLPEFAAKLEPFWDARGSKTFAVALTEQKSAAADALLGVADSYAANPRYAAVSKAYGALRPKAKGMVEDAMPRVGTAIEALA